MERKLGVVAAASANVASDASRSFAATAIALLVVPKSRPMTGSITCYPAMFEFRSHSNVEQYARVPGQDRCAARTSLDRDQRRAGKRTAFTTHHRTRRARDQGRHPFQTPLQREPGNAAS